MNLSMDTEKHVYGTFDEIRNFVYTNNSLWDYEEETKKICQETIRSVGAASMKDMGKVMGALKAKHADTIDFSKVSSIIKELLN